MGPSRPDRGSRGVTPALYPQLCIFWRGVHHYAPLKPLRIMDLHIVRCITRPADSTMLLCGLL